MLGWRYIMDIYIYRHLQGEIWGDPSPNVFAGYPVHPSLPSRSEA